MKVKDFKELNVYKIAFASALQIFEQSKGFPNEERYSLTDQLRRSTRSVCANVAEAWGKRRYPAAFVSKLSDADAEAAETMVWLEMAVQCGYLKNGIYKELVDHYDHICAQLSKMMSAPEQWCNPSGHKRQAN